VWASRLARRTMSLPRYGRSSGTRGRRVLFEEAVRCFQQGAWRAAMMMTWLAIAEGMRCRFRVAAEQDAEFTGLLEELAQREKEASGTALPSPGNPAWMFCPTNLSHRSDLLPISFG